MKIKLTESKLKQIVAESVEKVLNEMYENTNNSENESLHEGMVSNFVNSFGRGQNRMEPLRGLNVGDGKFNYDSKKNEFYYIDANSNTHYTGIKYGEGRIGRNYNPFGAQVNGGGVSGRDVKDIQKQLMAWAKKNVYSIDDNVKSSNNEYEQNRQYNLANQSIANERSRNNVEKADTLKRQKDPNYTYKKLGMFDHM